ncbi:histidine kinase [Streptomyces sp. NBC_00568]|uniref:sensor histidine kinase n=1 Tax=Streptomyces sp. NBC_00568 TaxID=2975779 RepID=UPI00224E028A|nr:histidine kinase [Streptomyces sp. NBC_00568]MCX4993602.1 histidine kinase [Streptomyces sp. NBC_00568]
MRDMEKIRTWLLPIVLAVTQVMVLWRASTAGEEPLGLVSLVGVLAALVLETGGLGWRRHEPMWALAGSLGAALIRALVVPDLLLEVGILIALYSVAVRRGGRASMLATAGATLCGWAPHAVRVGSLSSALDDFVVTAVVCVACTGLGEGRRQWLGGRWAANGRLARAEDGVRQAADTERQRLARELHDVSAHHLTSVVVTVDAARRLGGSRPELVADALDFAERTGRETLTALGRLVAVMRDGQRQDPRPMSGRIQELVAGFGRLGRPITTELAADLAGPAAEAAFGIVREALTNALRHAPDAAVCVRVKRVDGTLELTVDNDAPRFPPEGRVDRLGSGRGMPGMRERAAAVGGTLTAGPGPGGGWRVTAHLPDTTGPRRPASPSRRRNFLKEQRLADAALVFTAAATPLLVVLIALENGAARPVTRTVGSVLALLMTVHALPLWWRRRAPRAALLWVAATTWAWPAAAAWGALPTASTTLLPVAGLAEVMAVYAVGAYGRGAARTWPLALAAAGGLACALTAAFAVDGALLDERVSPAIVVWTAIDVSSGIGLAMAAVWALGLAVRRRRLRAVAREEGAFADSVRKADVAAGAERARIATGLQESVLHRTARMVELAQSGLPDEVAAQARSALAAMRELLRSLHDTAPADGHHHPQPTLADLDGLCRALRVSGRKVTLQGVPCAEGLPAQVALSAYRIVEGALSAGDRNPARVVLKSRPGTLHITVTGVSLAVAGPVAERLRIQVEAADGRMATDQAGTLRISLPVANLPVPAEEVPRSPYV